MHYTKLLVLTDIHIVESGADIIGLDPTARFRQALDHALANHGDAERIVITGDLAHHGRPAQYEHLQDILETVDLPVTLMLGNHDRRDAYQAVFGGAGFVQNHAQFDDTACVFLDTLDGPPYPKGHHSGLLCPERLAWLDAKLETSERAIVFMHHPPFDTGFDGMDAINLSNADDFFEIVHRHGNVEHLICGHVHRTISGTARGVPFTIFKSPCHQMPMLLGEAGTSHSVDEPGAYGIVLIGRDSVVIHSQDVGIASHAKYDPISN